MLLCFILYDQVHSSSNEYSVLENGSLHILKIEDPNKTQFYYCHAVNNVSEVVARVQFGVRESESHVALNTHTHTRGGGTLGPYQYGGGGKGLHTIL